MLHRIMLRKRRGASKKKNNLEKEINLRQEKYFFVEKNKICVKKTFFVEKNKF